MKMKKAGDLKVAVAYIRVSTEDQNLGPEAQRAAIQRWGASRGVTVAEVFVDHGVSGGAQIDERPGLLGALSALRAHGAGILVVSKRDRLARDIVVAAMIEQAAGRAGALVATADGTGEGTSPEAALMRGIVDVFAQYERAVIRSRTKAALGVKRSKGERVSGWIPFGQRLADDGIHLVADEAERAAIAEVRRLRTGGLSLAKTAEAARAMGLRSRSGKPFQATQIARMVAA